MKTLHLLLIVRIAKVRIAKEVGASPEHVVYAMQYYMIIHCTAWILQFFFCYCRYLTLLLYLNEEGLEGGETSFPRWVNAETFDELRVNPEEGKVRRFGIGAGTRCHKVMPNTILMPALPFSFPLCRLSCFTQCFQMGILMISHSMLPWHPGRVRSGSSIYGCGIPFSLASYGCLDDAQFRRHCAFY